MNSRAYRFRSKWEIEASKERVWQALTATPFSWEKWWPQIKEVIPIEHGDNEAFKCTWKTTGYSISCDIEVTKTIELREIVMEFKSSGDLYGTSTCVIDSEGSKTTLSFTLNVQTTKSWMNNFAPLLKPIFIFNHNVLMNSGEQGLQEYLDSQATIT